MRDPSLTRALKFLTLGGIILITDSQDTDSSLVSRALVPFTRSLCIRLPFGRCDSEMVVAFHLWHLPEVFTEELPPELDVRWKCRSGGISVSNKQDLSPDPPAEV